VCPVRIDLPSMLVRLRRDHVAARVAKGGAPSGEALAMKAAAWVMGSHTRFATAGRSVRFARPLLRKGRPRVPLPGADRWTAARDLPDLPTETFRDWWARTRTDSGAGR
jgi:L-lactate dehydrogenase complex protein LldF